MGNLDDLYQDILMHHVNQPANRADLTDDEVDAEEFNPLCGDRVRMSVELAGDLVERVRFDGEGCAICIASASIGTGALVGLTSAAATALCERMLRICRAEEDLVAGDSQELGAVAGVRQFPMRVKCATLPWHALKHAVAHQLSSSVS